MSETPTAAPAPGVRALLALAMPMVLARATQAVISFADYYQVRSLGPEAQIATATGGINVYAFVILPMGLAFIIQSFVAQLVGSGQRSATPRFAWYGLGISAISGAIALAAAPLVPVLLALTDFAPGVQSAMSSYMSIRLTAVAAIVATEALGNWYGGLGNTRMQMTAGVIAMVVNIALNWVLIEGQLGLPALGVDGAALASSLASWSGFAFLAVCFWLRRGNAPEPSRPLGLSRREFRRVLRFGLPNGLNWFLEFGAFQMFINVVFADLGTTATAAFNAIISINSVSFMPAFGLASSGAILAAQAIGARRRDLVWPHVRTTLLCTTVWMGVIGLVYAIIPTPLLQLLVSRSDEGAAVVAVGTSMLIMSAAWQLFDAVAMTFSESLRAAGDTRWTMAARLLLAWFLFFPGAYLAVVVAGGGPLAAMLALVVYLVVLSAALVLRFRSGAWKRIEIIELPPVLA